jgi:5'-deoxynucleotidase YfbR-like HD superfamily hydrolase
MATWIQTYSGKKFDIINPTTEMLDIKDIARSLSMRVRFSGHINKPYTVAQHSVFVSRVVEASDKATKDDIRWGLMHDAAEAYIMDIPRPIKKLIPLVSQIEEKILQLVAKRFGLEFPFSDLVVRADDVALVSEAYELLDGGPIENWAKCYKVNTVLPIKCATWLQSEKEFLKRFKELGLK